MPGAGTFYNNKMHPERVLGFSRDIRHHDAMLPNRISALRKEKGWSQTKLAEAIGTTLPMMGKLERGERPLNSEWLEKIGAALEVEPYRIIAPERIFPTEQQLADMLQLAQQQIPAGLPYSEWPRSVAAGLRTRLLTLADDRANDDAEDDRR